MLAFVTNVENAARVLRDGGLVAFPTETVYGLGANALDPHAVARVFEAKQRPFFDPLIVHLSSVDDLGFVIDDLPAVATVFAGAFWPGPLTIVFSKSDVVPSIVTSGLSTVAVRVPAHPMAHELISTAGVPVAAPSANRFGFLSPTRAEHVVESLGGAVDFVLDGGPTSWGVESTIIDVTRDVPTVLRHGAITLEQIESVVGNVRATPESSARPVAPGQLASHYAPRTPLRFACAGADIPAGAAYLAFQRERAGDFVAIEVLSPEGDLREAAANLFDALHRLDSVGAAVIFAERVPDTGLGRAINDRLARASA